MVSLKEIEGRLEQVKKRVEADFPGLVEALESGLKFACVTEQFPEFDFDTEYLQSIGGMVMLCKLYHATVIFTGVAGFGELNRKFVAKY